MVRYMVKGDGLNRIIDTSRRTVGKNPKQLQEELLGAETVEGATANAVTLGWCFAVHGIASEQRNSAA